MASLPIKTASAASPQHVPDQAQSSGHPVAPGGRGYSPDRNLTAFPSVPSPADKPQPSAAGEPLTAEDLLALWSAERAPAPATLRAYQGKFRQLTHILGFDDLRRATPELVVRFKEARLKEGRDAGTHERHPVALYCLSEAMLF